MLIVSLIGGAMAGKRGGVEFDRFVERSPGVGAMVGFLPETWRGEDWLRLLDVADLQVLLLVGEPGAGKSVALRQLRAGMQGQDAARHVGEIVNLRRCSPNHLASFVLAPLVDIAGCGSEPQVVFLDGIDECRGSVGDWLPVLGHYFPKRAAK